MTLHDADARLQDGDSTAPEPLRPPTPGGISLRPAMIVLGLAVLILLVFVTIGFLSSQPPVPVKVGGPPTAVPGTTLRAQSAAVLLSSIVEAGEPPTNIRNAVAVPAGAQRLSHQDNSGDAAGQFDSQVVFRSDDSQGALLAFFAADMKLQGWQVFDRGPADHDPGALEVLGKLAGSDGYYWEMGAIVSPTTFSSGGPTHGQTEITIRLEQEEDAD
jgi:hypothetical protein